MTDALERYLADRTIENRNAVVTEFCGLAESQSRRYAHKYPVPVGELLSDCYLGLIRAVELFDPAKKVKFQTWAIFKMHGAVMDGLRDRDHLSRVDRKRNPGFQVVQVPDTHPHQKRRDALFDVEFTGQNPSDEIDAADLREAVSRGTSKKERTIVRMAVDGRTNLEMARKIGVCESYVCLMRKRLRDRLTAADTWRRLTA